MIEYDPFLRDLVHVFRRWSSPRDGELFERHLERELCMGRLADAWNAKKQQLTDLTTQVGQLQEQLQQGSQPFTTPNGYQPDATDGAAIDEIVATLPPPPPSPLDPVPAPPEPPAGT